MNTVVPEARITLNSRLLCKNVVILTFQVSDNLLESVHNTFELENDVKKMSRTYANSLSMLSPNPGVSTIVRAMRTPSSSNSNRYRLILREIVIDGENEHTNIDRLNPNAFFYVRCFGAVTDLMCENL